MLLGVTLRFLSSGIMHHYNRVVGSTWQLEQGTKQHKNNSSWTPNDWPLVYYGGMASNQELAFDQNYFA